MQALLGRDVWLAPILQDSSVKGVASPRNQRYWHPPLEMGLCTLIAIAVVHGDNRLACAMAVTLFATSVALSSLVIAAYSRPFTGAISVKHAHARSGESAKISTQMVLDSAGDGAGQRNTEGLSCIGAAGHAGGSSFPRSTTRYRGIVGYPDNDGGYRHYDEQPND
jgi:hypothetical protein